MKSVLISIRPEWCEKIASGEKTIEVRKTKPKLETPFRCYIYESRGDYQYGNADYHPIVKGNGLQKVIGEFVCDCVKMLAPFNHIPDDIDVENESCLTREQIVTYLKGKGYGWHISDLKIYDKPKELLEFEKAAYDYGRIHLPPSKLTRPPQAWCYVEDGAKNETT